MAAAIEDYALIGDCETAALIGRDGSLDWLCWPRFDSPACFAALLGGPEHGRWLLAPATPIVRRERAYREDTLILLSTFETETGAVLLTDFMPLRGTNSDIIRRVTGQRGRVNMYSELIIRFDYGRSVPWVTRLDDGRLRAIAGPHMLVLGSDVPLRRGDMSTVSEFTVAAGETVDFILTYGASHLPPPTPIDPNDALTETETFWREWAKHCTVTGHWSEPVRRSLITLKALTYRPTGGIVAAATTSLPELLGGGLQWIGTGAYRQCSC